MRMPVFFDRKESVISAPNEITVVNGKHSIRYFWPQLWSKLSMCDREKPSLNSFRTSLRKLVLTSLVKDSCNGQLLLLLLILYLK